MKELRDLKDLKIHDVLSGEGWRRRSLKKLVERRVGRSAVVGLVT
jgi:hypothetical protein